MSLFEHFKLPRAFELSQWRAKILNYVLLVPACPKMINHLTSIWFLSYMWLGNEATCIEVLASFPGLSRFRSSVCIHNGSRRAWKQGRPGNTYHVNDVRWMWGGRRGGGAWLQVWAQYYTWEWFSYRSSGVLVVLWTSGVLLGDRVLDDEV